MRAAAYVAPASLDARCAAWLGEVRGLVRPRPQLVLRPERCVLLVIDLVRLFAHPEGAAYLPACAAVLPRVERLLRAWRSMGGTVVHTRHCHRGPEEDGMLGRFYRGVLRCDDPDSRMVAVTAPAPGEPLLRKTTYDAFHRTGLEELLRGRGVEQVLICGVLTHLCCATTARAAFVRGFEVYLAADGTASSQEHFHRAALLTLADACAVVLSGEEVLARCP